MYNLIEYSDNSLEISRSLWEYYKDERFIDNNGVIIDAPDDPTSVSFKNKQKITGQTGNNGTKDIQMIVPLTYFSNFWRTFVMLIINCEVNIFLTWSKVFIIVKTKNQSLQ